MTLRAPGDGSPRRFKADDPILLEDKGGALVLHYRAHPKEKAPRRRPLPSSAAKSLADLSVIGGHDIFEIRQRGVNKARALDLFMVIPPFVGRVPVFVGDDATDEDGLQAAETAGGFGVKVGPGRTAARYRLADVTAVHRWLADFGWHDTNSGTKRSSSR